MQIHEIKRKNINKKSVQIGRGGKRGKTSGRGMKGQTARAGHKDRPVLRDQIKKLPKRRGYGKNRARTVNDSRPVFKAVFLSTIDKVFSAGEVVNPSSLVEKGIVKKKYGRAPLIKIVSNGDIKKKVSFEKIAFTQKAKDIAEKAGCTIKL